MKIVNSEWSTKQVIKHLQKTWRKMPFDKMTKYRDMSELDRARFDRHRSVLKH